MARFVRRTALRWPALISSRARIPIGALLLTAALATPGVSWSEESWTAKCNALAGSPYEPVNRGHGKTFEEIDAQNAVQACGRAVGEDASAANLFRFGRALHRSEAYTEALDQYRKAAEQGYAPA